MAGKKRRVDNRNRFDLGADNFSTFNRSVGEAAGRGIASQLEAPFTFNRDPLELTDEEIDEIDLIIKGLKRARKKKK